MIQDVDWQVPVAKPEKSKQDVILSSILHLRTGNIVPEVINLEHAQHHADIAVNFPAHVKHNYQHCSSGLLS